MSPLPRSSSTLAETRVAVREWVLRAESLLAPDPGEITAVDEIDARVRLSRTLAGRGVLDGDLDPLTAELVETALRVVDRPDAPGSSAPPRNGAARTCVGWPVSFSITSPQKATGPGANTPTCSP